jgi:radical SAM superfamily enzyme
LTVDCILLYGNDLIPVSKYAGTFRIATELRNHGYSVQCIDLTAYTTLEKEFLEVLHTLIGPNTLWIGLSTTFLYTAFGLPYYKSQESIDKKLAEKPQLSRGVEYFVNFVKERNPNTKLITGGSRRFMLDRYGFKIFRLNNDTEIVEYTDMLAKKASTHVVKYMGNVIDGSEFKDFTNSQILFQPEDIIDPSDTLPIEVSRGCIFKCKFCSFPLNGKKKGDWIKHSNILLDEFNRNYDMHGVTDYVFSDDTYNDSEDKVRRLYDEVYSKLNFKINFTTYIRLDLMMRFPDTVEYLKESGLKSALFGIETLNHESGKAIGKGVDPLLQFEFIEEIKKNHFKDILTFSGFIIGLPKDSNDDMYRLEEFLFSDKNKLDDFNVEPLFITPSQTKNETRTSYSEFDLEYEKYGYECYEHLEDSAYTELRWKNHMTNMTFDESFAFSRKINATMERSTKHKFGGFGYAWLKSIGISSDDLLSLSKNEIITKYKIKDLRENKKTQYKKQLLNFIQKGKL